MKGEMVGTQAADLDLPDAAEYAINIVFDDFRTFLKDFSANLALKGMFVEAAEPQPPGTEVAFELSLRDGHPLVEGRGVVAWSRAATGKAETASQGIRFLDLDPRSERLVRRIVEERTKAGLGLFDLDQEPSAGRDRVSEGDPAGPGTQAAAGGESDAGEIESLRAKIEKLKREQAEEQRRWQAELEAAREAEADLNSRLSDSLSRVVTISESRNALADQFRFAEDSHRRDRHRLEELEEERAKLEQAVEEQKSEVARWTEEAVAANTGHEALEFQKRSLEEEIEVERGKAEKFASEVEDAQATLSAEKTAKESLEKNLHEAKAALEKLETEADATETALRESLEQARADLEESAAKAGEFEKEVESLRSELGEIQGQSEAFQAEMASIRTELEQLKSHHDEMKAQAATQQEAAARAGKLVERVRAEHASLQDDLVEAQTALGEVADPERRLADELEEVRPEVFTPPPPQADSDELPEAENAPAPSKLRGRFAGLAQRLLGGRGARGTSDQFLHVPASEDTVSGSEADDFELAASEPAHANPRLPEQA
ncbi:MAG: PilZ domain-containing protein [Acidobacteria bacterium]|nr:PilZ domain-containing protein [Acidobacteriota bacterium]